MCVRRKQFMLTIMDNRLLSDVKIKDMASLEEAIGVMHARYGVPHIVITSVAIPHPDHPPHSLSVVGSSMTRRDKKARPFKIVFPAIDAYFSGTGDMFSALMAVRMREAALAAPAPGGGLGGRRSWLSGDEVGATELPLARAAEKVLGSMNEVLEATCRGMKEAVERAEGEFVGLDEEEVKRRLHLLKSRAAELRLVRNLDSLRSPTVKFKAVKM
jgi:pyridoxine kinase